MNYLSIFAEDYQKNIFESEDVYDVTTLFTGKEVFSKWNLGTGSKRLQDFFSRSRRLYHIDTYDVIKFEIDQRVKPIAIKFHM